MMHPLMAAEPDHTARMQGFDYAQPGIYFITVCTKDRVPWFGRVVGNEMQKSGIGELAEAAWLSIPRHYPDVRVDEFCTMPDHVHGILEIMAPGTAHVGHVDVGTQNFSSLRRWARYETTGNRFGPQIRNLASIVRGFKVGVTKGARSIDSAFAWQPRFWDRVVRDEGERGRIREYIRANPRRWWERNKAAHLGNCVS
jgi:REP element-mobilizing transposase RayT